MENQDLIAKIQHLKAIKPKKAWVLQTKAQVFGRDSLLRESASWRTSIFEGLRLPQFQFRLAYLILLLLITGLLGGVFIFLSEKQGQPQQLVQEQSIVQEQRTEQIIASLAKVQANLEAIAQDLNNLKNAQDPAQALVMTEVVKATVENVEKTIDQVESESKNEKDTKGSSQVLASLIEIKETSQGLIEESKRLQIEMIESLIEDLKQRSLTKVNQERLQKAESNYNEGKYNEAMILIERIYNE